MEPVREEHEQPPQIERRPRDHYVTVVCPALRDSLRHAIEDGDHPHKTRVLLAVLYFTAGYSRSSEAIYAGQIASLVKIPGDENERKTRAFLRELAAEGTITWEPKPGRSRRSDVGLRGGPRPRPLLGLLASENGPPAGPKTGRVAVEKPAVWRAPTEELDREVLRGEQRSPLQDLDLLEWGARFAAEREKSAAPVGTIARLIEVCPDADDGSLAVLESKYGQLPSAFIEQARQRILEAQPREPIRYAMGIARKELRKRGLA